MPSPDRQAATGVVVDPHDIASPADPHRVQVCPSATAARGRPASETVWPGQDRDLQTGGGVAMADVPVRRCVA
ncbi:MAG: hypothetical protein AVDCRST_MAG70-1514 [uncultured Thermomicrobiales bacterium]|uniref:Uncharacterized protein n=1 Tax=uncultured Thermomicrobiales bacterium TaxID=1645740 RepID=A0A6J4UXR9_9BACT|nr:MAG: hypothetical protein AVDCRST_MAG70-1514 [uncultured Thermomicrobiales bacterium]